MSQSASKPWEILTRRNGGPLMHFDGRKFTNNGVSRPYGFAEASHVARRLLRRYEILTEKNYHVWIGKIDWAKRRRKNPQGLDEAASKFENFTGHKADRVIETNLPQVKEGLVIGELDIIGYRVKREGVEDGKTVSYDHLFRKRSRPLLAVSKDGKQLLIVGGRYEFTEAGIEDR